MKLLVLIFVILSFLSFDSIAQQNINTLTSKEITVNGQLSVSSTTLASKPCPAMTETQRNAISSPATGFCVYNTTTLQLNVYNGTIWKSAGGGISNWETAFNYAIGDVVIESNKIYQANTAHTSNVFLSDIANWTQLANDVASSVGVLPVANGGTNSSTALSGSSIAISNGSAIVQGEAGTSSTVLHGNASGAPTYGAVALGSEVSGVLPLANGGTNKNMAAASGGVVWTDSDSQEVTLAGTAGQVFLSNGTSAPSFASAISGLTQLDVDNLRLDGNTISSTNTNGNIPLIPNGTGSVLVGTATSSPSAILRIDSTVSGLLPPRMTTTERNAISSPATGLQIFNTTSGTIDFYDGVGWLSSGGVSGPSCSFEISSAGVVSKETRNCVDGNCSVGDVSEYTCTWVSGFFTSNVNCVNSSTTGNNAVFASKEVAASTTEGKFRTATGAGTKTTSAQTVICNGN